MNNYQIISKQGTIKSFDDNTGNCVVTIDSEEIKFHSTAFYSESPTRFPQIQENVEVLFTKYKENKTLLIVRVKYE